MDVPSGREDRLVVVPRYLWGARESTPIAALHGPAKYLMFAFTERDFKRLKMRATPEGILKRTIDCVEGMQKLQHNDMRRLPDIRFNFVIGADGLLYEGRGWTIAPTLPNRYRHRRFDTMYIGYQGKQWNAAPTDIILERRREIIKHGVAMKYISEKVTELHLTMLGHDRMFLPNISEIVK